MLKNDLIPIELHAWEVDKILRAISTLIDDREEMLKRTICEEEILFYEIQIDELNKIYNNLFDKLHKSR